MQKIDLTVLTCHIPGREAELARNMASVRNQVLGPVCHVIIADDGSLGTCEKYNRAAKAVETEWIALLDDDNYWAPEHLLEINHALPVADVVYSFDASRRLPRINISGYNRATTLEFLSSTNCVDQSSAIRTSMWDRVGGFREDFAPRQWNDQDLFYRIAEAGGRFVCVPIDTWVYDPSPVRLPLTAS